jgi:hypothetical protein
VLLPLAIRPAAAQQQAPPAEETPVRPVPAPPRWSLGAGVGSGYDSNALFAGPDGASDIATRVQVSLGRDWTLRRGSIRLGADVTRPFYRNAATLSTFTYNFAGRAAYMLTPRLSWSFGTNVNQARAPDSTLLAANGIVLPNVVARTGATSTQFSYAWSRKTNIGWGFSFQGVGFRATVFASDPLKGGTSFGSSANVTRQVSPSQTLGITQSYQRMYQDGGAAGVQAYMGTWQASLGRSWSIFASGGIRPYTIPGESGYRISPGASGGIRKTVREGQSVGISYERTMEQAFGEGGGSGTHLVETVGGNYSLTLSRKLVAEFGASYARGTYPLIPDLLLIGKLANASLGYQIATGLMLSAGSSLYIRQYTPQPAVSRYNITVALSYGTAWR